jgi:hypothetical protein
MEGLDVTRDLGRIAECRPQLVHRSIQTAIKINERMIGPKGMAQFVPRHDLTGMLQQENEQVKGLFLQFDVKSMPAQFASTDIDLKRSEAKNRWRVCRFHGGLPRRLPQKIACGMDHYQVRAFDAPRHLPGWLGFSQKIHTGRHGDYFTQVTLIQLFKCKQKENAEGA